jgi:tetratricopeptide (TPR) repeat protein
VGETEEIELWCEGLLKVQKNSVWYTQIGNVLQRQGHKQAAEERAHKALKMDPNDWRASTLLAGLVRPSEGVAILKPAAQALESSGQWKRSSLDRIGLAKMFFIIAELSWDEGDLEDAIIFWNRALEVDFTDYGRVVKCLQFFAKDKLWSDIMQVLEKIHAESTEQLQGLSELISVAGGNGFPHDTALQAALHTEQLEFLVSAYEGSIELMDERGERSTACELLLHCGRATHAMQNGSSRAIKYWRRALDANDKYLLSALISNIAPYYIQKADASGSDPEAVSNYLKKIETLLPEGIPEGDVIVPPRIYIARYFLRQGNKFKAKQIARDSVKPCLDILSDDDEGNDLPAYNQLLSVFVAFADMANLMAVRALMVLHFKGKQLLHCNGQCNRRWSIEEETQWCRDCINANFEEECAQKITQNALSFTVCNSTHQFLRAPRLDDSVEHTPHGMVPFEGEEVPFGYWLGRIEKEYVSFEN